MGQSAAMQDRKVPAAATKRRMSDEQFETIRALMCDHVGIVLQESRRALVESRVVKRLRTLEIAEFGAYLDYLASDGSGRELALLIDAISTNVTEFFREKDHFDFISGEIARRLRVGERGFRFWSAGCSSGEEPYSLAMALRALPGGEAADIRILATDISTGMLRQAVQGSYLKETVATIPPELSRRYLLRSRAPEDDVYRVNEVLKNMIVFRRLNLNKTPFAIRGAFDMILCRNVMIYFDHDLRTRIVSEAHRLLKPGGHLLVGHAETLIGIENRFDFVGPAIYRKR